jgi:hypothetical protein
MKSHRFIYALIAAVICLSSCSKGFQDINTSPDAVIKPTLAYTLPDIELLLLDQAYYCNVTVLGQLMDEMSSYGSVFNTLTIGGNSEYHFTYQYSIPVKNVVDFINATKDSKTDINYNCIGRIMRVYALHTLTDLYGDVPYFDAGKGYLDKNFQPAYDDQKLIYADMLNELQDAATKFDATQPIPTTADIVYAGNIDKWKRFAYSLMLRLALRMNKPDPQNSAKWISTAINGGLMQSNADNFTVYYKPNTYYATISNGQSTPVVYYDTWKLAEPFVKYLRDNKDPRIHIYSVLPNGDTTTANQLGLPPFTPSNQVPLELTSYSYSPKTTFGKYDAPFIHLAYSQVQYMLSEIALRNLVPEATPADANGYFQNGVRAAMDELSIYGGDYKITTDDVNQYLLGHQLDISDMEGSLNQINSQYWVETHYNFYETFANWRRSGYPKLDESKGALPRRLMYTTQETNINSANVQAAVSRQGPDLTTTRVWWDK